MSYPRTDAHRAMHAQRAREHKPWEKSTGPTTEQGKAASRMNATKHGVASRQWRDVEAALRALMDQLL